jgi:hypothetical protein
MAEAWLRNSINAKVSSRASKDQASKKKKPEAVDKGSPRTMRDWFLKLEPKENSIPEAEASSKSSPPPVAKTKEGKRGSEENDDARGSAHPTKKKLKPIDQDNFYGQISLPKKSKSLQQEKFAAAASHSAETHAFTSKPGGSGWGAQRRQMGGGSDLLSSSGRAGTTNSLLCDDDENEMDETHADCAEEMKRESVGGGDARSVWKSLHNQVRLSTRTIINMGME